MFETFLPLQTRLCFLPIDDQDALSILRDLLTREQLKQFALLQQLLGIEVELSADSFGYLPARATAEERLLVFGIADDEVVGYASCLLVDYCDQRHGLVTEVIVRGEHQARGFGRQIVETVGWAIRQRASVQALRAIVDMSNERARRLFTRTGYEAIGHGRSSLFHRSITRA